MSRHEIKVPKGTWVTGWDPPLGTFFLQFYDVKSPEGYGAPVIWLGGSPRTSMLEIEDIVSTAQKHGLTIDQDLQAKLYADKDEGR